MKHCAEPLKSSKLVKNDSYLRPNYKMVLNEKTNLTLVPVKWRLKMGHK